MAVAGRGAADPGALMLSVELRHAFAGFALDVSFTAQKGVTALFGRSGAGKTCIVNAIAGILRPAHGVIVSDDTVLMDSRSGRFLPPHRRGIGYVFQDARLFPHLSVRQNLFYGRWLSRRRAEADAGRIIEMLGIGPLLTRRPGALSGGESQRVALGRAILSDPRLLLMDEPLVALDQDRKAEILPYLERLRDEIRLPILYVSHSPAEIARLATSIVLIGNGRVLAAGPAADILSDPATAPLVGLPEAGAILQARIRGHDGDGLTRLETAAGPLWLAQQPMAAGRSLRLRILARDVMIARQRPEAISALNILPVRICDLTPIPNGVVLRLDAGGEKLLAAVTQRSVQALGLAPGQQVHAVIKAVSVLSEHIGANPDMGPAAG